MDHASGKVLAEGNADEKLDPQFDKITPAAGRALAGRGKSS